MGVITIDLRKRQLIYEQIVENVKEQIGRGVILENDYMPSVRALANDLGINPNTIQKAYAELERQGVIQSVPGKGSLVIMSADDILGRKRESVAVKIREAAVSAAAERAGNNFLTGKNASPMCRSQLFAASVCTENELGGTLIVPPFLLTLRNRRSFLYETYCTASE